MSPAKDRMRNNISKPLDRACAGRVLPERNMRSHLVIIDGIFRELEDSFPASDPPSLTGPTTEMGGRIVSATKRSKAGAEIDPGAAFTTAALSDT
jgi:hypothetical protein